MARVITGAETGETVVFLDGDRQNHARGNLAKLTTRDAFKRAQGRSSRKPKGAAA